MSEDRNVEAIRAALLERSQRGIAKYGVTTCRNPLEFMQWMQHLQEELLDAAVYIEQLKRKASGQDVEVDLLPGQIVTVPMADGTSVTLEVLPKRKGRARAVVRGATRSRPVKRDRVFPIS